MVQATSGISVVIPWCDRSALQQTLQKNRYCFSSHAAEVLLINLGGNREDLTAYAAGLQLPKLRMIHALHEPFNKAKALNIGLAKSISETVVFLDADIEIDESFFNSVALMEQGVFFTLARVEDIGHRHAAGNGGIEHISYTISIAFKNQTETAVLTKRLYLDSPGRNAPGVVAAKRSDLVAIGGLNSTCRDWGWEDIDLIFRLQHFLNLTRREAGLGIHYPSVEDCTVGNEVKMEASETINFANCLSNYSDNNFLGTLRMDALTATEEERSTLRPFR